MTTLAIILLGSGITLIWTAATNRDIRDVVRSVVSGEPIPEAGPSQADREKSPYEGMSKEEIEQGARDAWKFGPGGAPRSDPTDPNDRAREAWKGVA